MDQIILDLHQVLDRGKTLIKEYEARLYEVTEREKAANGRQVMLDAQANSLVERETACAAVENVVDLHEKANKMYADASARLNDALDAEKRIRKASEEESQKLANQRELVRKETMALEARQKAIDEEVAKRVQETLTRAGLGKQTTEV